MAKVNLNTLSSGYASIDFLNNNFIEIETAFDNTLSRDGSTPNQMEADLDMNAYRILNVPPPMAETDVVRLKDIPDGAELTTAALTGLSDTAGYFASDNLEGAMAEVGPLLHQTFDSVAEMEASSVLSVGQKVRTLGYYEPGDGGGNDYEIVAAGTGTDDGGSFIDLSGSGLQAKGLFGADITPEMFGAVGDGTTDDSSSIVSAIEYAYSTKSVYDSGDGVAVSNGSVVFRPGRTYYIPSTISLDLEGEGVDFTCPGRCILKGDGTSKGITFNKLYQSTFDGILFSDFTTAVEFDTNNVSQATVSFRRCGSFNNTIFVDSRSFSESRSTILSFDDCISTGTPRFVKSFCDKLVIKNSFIQNSDATVPPFYVDSLAEFTGNICVPVAIGANSRWVDFFSSEIGGRSLDFRDNRWSGEGGGISVVWVYNTGNDNTSRIKNHITFSGGVTYSDATELSNKSVIVLRNDGAGGSHSPNQIRVDGTNWKGNDGFVSTESGNAPALSYDEFIISMSQDSLVTTLSGSFPIVSDELIPYLDGKAEFGHEEEVTTTSSFTLSARRGPTFFMNPSSSATLTNITDGRNGEEVTLVLGAGGSNLTVENATTGTGNIRLNGGTDWSTGNVYDTLRLQYRKQWDEWVEVSRSTN